MPRKTTRRAARRWKAATARQRPPIVENVPVADDLSGFACPNEDCCDFNRFAAGNLSICERMGKEKCIRRLYCKSCGQRFSERQGSLLAHSKLPEETVVRIVKCLGYGCSVEAAADICEVDPRTVELMLTKAAFRAFRGHEPILTYWERKRDITDIQPMRVSRSPFMEK